ncbi:hypothetical protein L6452_14032 [Arctium lappa]|uniref:Uncharacterized protein n=1 Tax=Arctium lappa TaxID=4217 RepID=A0ACB9CJY8_ARCLA|nr:hypothetical protein L6452_14032 [Arctium lappa]
MADWSLRKYINMMLLFGPLAEVDSAKNKDIIEDVLNGLKKLILKKTCLKHHSQKSINYTLQKEPYITQSPPLSQSHRIEAVRLLDFDFSLQILPWEIMPKL